MPAARRLALLAPLSVVALGGPAAPAADAACRTRPVVISVAPINGEAVRTAKAFADGRLVVSIRRTRITKVTLKSLRPGKRRIELQLTSRHHTRVVTLVRTARCA